MRNKWKYCKLKNICKITMGQSPPSETYNLEKLGIPFFQGRKDFGFKYPKVTMWCKKPQRIAEPNSVLISVRAPVGDINITREKCCIGRGLAAINGQNNEFIYYLMKFNEKKLKSIFENEGTVFGCITKEGLNEFEVYIPEDKITQQRIASILSAFDDKIELNNRMNKTLEVIAQAIFKHWFIDFEFPSDIQNLPSSITEEDWNNPSFIQKIKSILKSPGYKSSGGKMVKSELGLIPEGWEIRKLKDIIIKNRKKIKDKNKWKNLKVIDLSVMPNFSIVINNFNNGENFQTNIFELNEYDILFGSIRPYFGKAGFSPIKGAVTGTVHSFRPKEKIYFSYILLTIANKNFIDYAIRYSKGTKMPIIDWNNLVDFIITLPQNKKIIFHFEIIVKSLIDKIKENILQNQTLSQLRDSLLPRLMSGKIRLQI
ncbi:MAG: restriction endonuclease subunit S [Candidatus Goldbacteria bacterium]|nr:restriction endonuclease subunit S [Candidatus Goldiibacteriota bacterium]